MAALDGLTEFELGRLPLPVSGEHRRHRLQHRALLAQPSARLQVDQPDTRLPGAVHEHRCHQLSLDAAERGVDMPGHSVEVVGTLDGQNGAC